MSSEPNPPTAASTDHTEYMEDCPGCEGPISILFDYCPWCRLGLEREAVGE